jgi:hypothetical protein
MNIYNGKMSGADLIAIERERQIKEEGWTVEHDAHHTKGQLAMAACAYAATQNIAISAPKVGLFVTIKRECLWPFHPNWFKPSFSKNRVRELVKAGALIAAEIDRINNDH